MNSIDFLSRMARLLEGECNNYTTTDEQCKGCEQFIGGKCACLRYDNEWVYTLYGIPMVE